MLGRLWSITSLLPTRQRPETTGFPATCPRTGRWIPIAGNSPSSFHPKLDPEFSEDTLATLD
ncbi:hypothetical protein KEM48_003833 [Puccinia striiformis f. sp. tritici PST-130]|nr:hypothetical protein KEM48_003833 [Puccinia striiformis f. sp. tritici PST-130]